MSMILELFTSNLEKTKNLYSEKSSNLLKVANKKRLNKYLNEVKKKEQIVTSIKRYSDEFSADVKRRREDSEKNQQELLKMSTNCQESTKSMKVHQKKLSDLVNFLEASNNVN
ncbi:hypothetical protein ACFFRR_001891 [Megaselia abdita]